MEVLYLVCGARRPQLKRNPLGGGTNFIPVSMPSLRVPELPRALARLRAIYFVIAGVAAVLALVSLVAAHYWTGLFFLVASALNLNTALRMVAKYLGRIQETERDGWRAIANGPIAQCPHCGWLSYNGHTTHCVECGTALGKIPATGNS